MMRLQEVSWNQAQQKSFIWMQESDSGHFFFRKTTHCHLAVILEACETVTVGGRAESLARKPPLAAGVFNRAHDLGPVRKWGTWKIHYSCNSTLCVCIMLTAHSESKPHFLTPFLQTAVIDHSVEWALLLSVHSSINLHAVSSLCKSCQQFIYQDWKVYMIMTLKPTHKHQACPHQVKNK